MVRSSREPPTRDETPETFEDYLYESFMYRDELPWKDRSSAATKLMRTFKNSNTAAWRLMKRLREDASSYGTLSRRYGVEFLLQQLKKAGNQLRRQVVDTVEADVLQHAQRRASASSRQSSHHD